MILNIIYNNPKHIKDDRFLNIISEKLMIFSDFKMNCHLILITIK